jgi:hypothetical protein
VRWHERLAMVIHALAMASLWLPWVDHKAAALVLTGWDLPEFARFMPEARSGGLVIHAQAFWGPSLAFAFCVLTGGSTSRLGLKPALARLAVAAAVLAVPFPPIDQALAYAACLAASAALLTTTSLSVRARHAAILVAPALGALASTLPPWQLRRLLPALQQLYNAPITIGFGAWLCAGCALTSLALAIRSLFQEVQAAFRGASEARSRRPANPHS